jgi:hypothetical protein
MSQGRPTAVSDLSYDTEAFPIIKQQSNTTDMYLSSTIVFAWKVKLAQIQSHFCGALCRAETGAQRANSLAALDEALMKWRDDIPFEIRPEQEILVNSDSYRPVAILHLDYYNTLRALHWASITSFPMTDPTLKAHLNRRMRSSESICLNAARSFVKVLNEYDDPFIEPECANFRSMVEESADMCIFALRLVIRRGSSVNANFLKSPYRSYHGSSRDALQKHFQDSSPHFRENRFGILSSRQATSQAGHRKIRSEPNLKETF